MCVYVGVHVCDVGARKFVLFFAQTSNTFGAGEIHIHRVIRRAERDYVRHSTWLVVCI